MASTFFGLNIAYTGLLAANANLNTTGNNISNVETKGYSRQQAVQTAADAIRMSQQYGMAGAGVNTTEITQIRDKYYDLKYWQSQTNLGQYEIKEYYNLQIENYFTETENAEGFGTIFSNLFSSLDEVRKQSGEGTVKNQFLADAGNLCEYFNAMSTNLEKLQLDANAEIKNKVDEINAIAEQIATLNKQINTIEVNNTHANDLRDKRALLIDQLSKIVDVEVRETPITIAAGSDVKSNINNYEVTISGGQILVDGYDYNTLRCIARQEKVNQSDAEGLYDIKWTFGKPGSEDEEKGLPFDLYGRNLGGELKGLIEIRDGNNEEYFHGKVESVGDTVKVNVTEEYLNDIDKVSIPPTGILTVSGKEVKYTGFTYTGNGKDSGTYEFTLEEPLNGEYDGKDATIGREINYQGIPYYQEQMNEFVRMFARAMNDIERTAQVSNGEYAKNLFNGRNIMDGSNPYDFGYADDGSGKDYTESNGKKFGTNITKTVGGEDVRVSTFYDLTASNFQVNKDMVKDVDKFGTTFDINQGRDAQDITEKLLTVQDDKNKVKFRGCSSKEFLQCLTADVALNTNNAVTFTKNYSDINQAVSNQRTSVMGVDNDEEALNLVKYQEAYNLAAKMMQVMTEIYDQLILNTGV